MRESVHRRGAEPERERGLDAKDAGADINVVDVDKNPRDDLVPVVCFLVVAQRDKVHRAFIEVIPVHLR